MNRYVDLRDRIHKKNYNILIIKPKMLEKSSSYVTFIKLIRIYLRKHIMKYIISGLLEESVQ